MMNHNILHTIASKSDILSMMAFRQCNKYFSQIISIPNWINTIRKRYPSYESILDYDRSGYCLAYSPVRLECPIRQDPQNTSFEYRGLQVTTQYKSKEVIDGLQIDVVIAFPIGTRKYNFPSGSKIWISHIDIRSELDQKVMNSKWLHYHEFSAIIPKRDHYCLGFIIE